MEWVSMDELLHASLTSPSTIRSVRWSDVKHNTTGFWSSGNLFCGVMNLFSLCQSDRWVWVRWSTVSGIIGKWKRLGSEATQPRSERPCNVTEWGDRVLKHMVRKNIQHSADSITEEFQTSNGINISIHTHTKKKKTACKPHIIKYNAKSWM